jgi:MFS family permease
VARLTHRDLGTPTRNNILIRVNIRLPQPSDDPEDPLNWSWAKKHAILFTISAVAFLPDYGSSIGAVTLIPQSIQWHVTQDEMLRSLVGNVFMEGAAGPFIVALMAYFGRLPVLFWFTVFALWTAAMCAGSKTLDQFIAARVLGGTFSTAAQAGGLSFINDMFFVHEHARKINIWSFFFILSPYLGPLLTAFIINKYSWVWAFWLYTLMTGLCLIAVVIFGEETYYNRNIAPDMQPKRKSRIMRLIGVEQYKSRHQRISFVEAITKPISVILKPVVLISCFYTFLIFSWVIGE